MARGVPGDGEIASVLEGEWSDARIPGGLNDGFLGGGWEAA